ncbi:MAG: hypothetical protein C5B46_01175 [Proteobacteria bacterium]|nr:MAG: hypothetical protein C5B46_01175 [Pseudomonadota bacterium]
MLAMQPPVSTARYAKCIDVSKRVRWDIDRDVVRGRRFDFSKKFLPDGLSLVPRFEFLTGEERRLLSQIQGRTYANMFALAERFIGAKMLDLGSEHWMGDQVALEALVRSSEEEIKHQTLFRRVDKMIGESMPAGYRFWPPINDVAELVLRRSTWAVLAFTCHIELLTQTHFRRNFEIEGELCELFKDVFLFHWKEESQHAILDELEWIREDGKLDAEQRERGVSDLIELVRAMDGLLQLQAPADVDYFLGICARPFAPEQISTLQKDVLQAYRWQYIGSGFQDPRFAAILAGMVTHTQSARIDAATAPLMS